MQRARYTLQVPRLLRFAAKLALTIAIFWILLSHPIDMGDGNKVPLLHVLRGRLLTMDWQAAAPFLLLAMLIKFAGIFCAMLRWHLLLIGQRIRFNFGHVVGSFLIGRFLGTFLPGTLGLDGYKLYDASRFSGQSTGAAAATVVEKIFGLLGIVLTFLITMPWGYSVLGADAAQALALTVPLALLLFGAGLAVLMRPAWLARLPTLGQGRTALWVQRVMQALATYADQMPRLALCLALSFGVHFCTASMYFFTACAVGAVGATFFQVVFASSIQIFATVVSPFTIAGEGVREVVQALLLAKHLGLTESILSAALGFWAAEALTVVGAFVWWGRSADYQPRVAQNLNSVA